MADEPTVTPTEDNPQKGPTKEETQSQQDWKQLEGMSKFKSEADLAKAYRELESKQAQMGEEVRQTREFAEIINPLLEEIRNDPEIFNKLDEKLRKKGQPDATDSKDPKADANGQATEEMRSVTSDLILARFEEKYGIKQLPPDEQKVLRQKIGDVILETTGRNLNGIDLRRLNSVLENAYILANKDKLIEKSKLEALAQRQSLDEASISSLPSSQGKGEESLSSEEATIAQRLGLTREQYLSGKKKK